MESVYLPLAMGGLIFLASLISIRTAISVAIIEIAMGVIGGNFLGLHTTPWIDFLAGLASILLTFLAGTEVDTELMKSKFKESMVIGVVSFLTPFIATFAYCYYLGGWSFQASQIAGIALSTTSLAVIYAVLVETGLAETNLGKLLMSSCFVTDFGTALALSLLFSHFTLMTLVFLFVSTLVIVFLPKVITYIVDKYGDRVIEPEIKFLFLVLFLLMYVAELGDGHAVLPAFILGLMMSKTLSQNRPLQRKLRIISFSLLTPFFFMKAGMNVSLPDIYSNLGILLILFLVKLVPKILGVYPFAKMYVPQDAVYTTLLMSTGLTFGTISSMYGLSAGIIDKTQFSLLVTTIILSAIIPTVIAQKWFSPSCQLDLDQKGAKLN